MKRTSVAAILLILSMLLCACAEIPPASSELPPVSSESAEPSTSPDPTPTEAVSPTPAPTATPIPQKKPTATPTVSKEPIKTASGSVPKAKGYVMLKTVEGLKTFIETTDAEKYENGVFGTMLDAALGNGYFYKPVFGNGLVFDSEKGTSDVLAWAEKEKNSSGVCYRVTFEGTDALIYIFDISAKESNDAKEHLYAYECGKDLRAYGRTPEEVKNGAYKQAELAASNGTYRTWGRPFGERYRIWFVLDDAHIVTVEWFTNDAVAAEEFVSKLEFEKVEL